MNDLGQHTSDAPQLRTLLLTDLCDSTTLVERLGDATAAELFRAHDRLVLQLQQQWRGRLIDRSDGLLLLFERPIDGLGFALDYGHGLRTLGEKHKQKLLTRAGLHVGEVLTWRNSDEAVRVGAKPLEVEGLAKPTAARLMSMARPGQILLSAVAEPLAHRAARELGERGLGLTWKSHGRWHFKGVPSTQEVFEVGEPSIAPLRAPPNNPKAWRDIPLWRRPAALVAEVALVISIGIGAWFVTRPQPAIAFNQRDWVVVGDLRNLTGDSRFDDALEIALRLGLEQSRYVNVLPDAKVQDTLKQMGRDPAATAVDREIGAEIALRDGARAVLLPTVAEVGGRLRVSIEVVDPHTQATVFAESASGKGADSVVNSVGNASEALRQRLGEALASVQADSTPLEKATTPSLDALRAFTLGQEAFTLQKLDAAKQHFAQALSIDPKFAMASIGLARVELARLDVPAALQQMQLALRDTSRLTDRERLYANAQMALMRWDRDFISQWVALSKLYPDFHVAAFNVSYGMRYANRYPEMREYSSRAAVNVAITRPAALHYRAIAESALGRLNEAEQSVRQANSLGFSAGFVEPALIRAAMGKTSEAEAMLRKLQIASPQDALEVTVAEITVEADAGRWRDAERGARKLNVRIKQPAKPFEWAARAATLAVLRRTASKGEVRDEAKALIDQARKALPGNMGRARESVANAALYAGYVAASNGDVDLAKGALALTKATRSNAPAPVLANLAAIVEARIALSAGNAKLALLTLEPYNQPSALLLTQVVAADARRTLDPNVTPKKDTRAALEWRGRAYAEWAAERPPVIETLVAR